ncbi:phosphotransferase family protein [Sandarakinorhabdus sp.]|uniref:phosphotransferase family protein n=1 Tax=Sandarakinorhabdus sp. TaxID=1916663 RepID=UPI00286D8191|nr:phosphotransferase family protein [Sandarakinorhabdus sp.]
MRLRVSQICSTLPAELLARFLGEKWGEPVSITGIKRFHGGSARQTYRFDASAPSGRREALVLRRDPPSSLIETDRAAEFAALAAFHRSSVPVPEPLWCENTAFGSPGFLMREVAGGTAAGLMEPDPYGEDAAAIGTALFTALGAIHRTAPAAAGIAPVSAGDAAPARLDHWRRAFEADRFRPEPIVEAALRWLGRTQVAPAQRVSIVHGDYRSGNFLRAGSRLVAVLDWEMVHAGDPMEDLAWACDPLWSHGSGRPAATLPLADAHRVWERASGLTVDPEALLWWRMFAQVMGAVIWISAAREVIDGRSHDPVHAFAGIIPYRFHMVTLARSLSRSLSQGRGA